MEDHAWNSVRLECHRLLRQALERICELTGLPPLYPLESDFDDRAAYDQLVEYLRGFAPELRDRVKLHTDPMPIFDRYGIEHELDRTLDRKVWLKKGGYILIEQTEALVAIDVNTGRLAGKKNQEETILKTNMLAAREIARQLRLRDIGGIIVIDFIDMESEANKKKVLQELRTWLKRDRAKTKAFQVSDLGLVEMSTASACGPASTTS